MTAVVVSHDPGSAAIADRVVEIRDGRLAGEARGAAGAAAATAGEIVVGHGGWLRLPEQLLRAAAIGDRALVEARAGGLFVSGLPGAAPGAVVAQAAATGVGALVDQSAWMATPTHPPAALRAVSKSYGGRYVIDSLSATFAAGRLVALVGPSGSGKTTVLHLLAGLLLPDAGEIEIDGAGIGGTSREARANLRRNAIGYIGQAPGLIPHLDAQENVALALTVRGSTGADAAASAAQALAAVGVAGRDGQRVDRLSSGERQRVAIARALAGRPRLLLADEPTARLDRAAAAGVGALLAGLAREHGAAVVCATHDDALVDQADEVLRLGG